MSIDKRKETVKIAEDLTVENSARIRADFMGLLDRSLPVVLDLSEVQRADLAGLQLLCALHRSSCHRGEPIELGSFSPALQEALEEAALKRHVGCMADVDNTCVWLQACAFGQNEEAPQ